MKSELNTRKKAICYTEKELKRKAPNYHTQNTLTVVEADKLQKQQTKPKQLLKQTYTITETAEKAPEKANPTQHHHT